jgi:hypothetical protein
MSNELSTWKSDKEMRTYQESWSVWVCWTEFCKLIYVCRWFSFAACFSY